MPYTASNFWKVIRAAGLLTALISWSGIGHAQLGLPGLPGLGGGGGQTSAGLVGQASAVTAVVMGNTTSLANTGTLTAPSEPLGTGQVAGSIAGLLSAEALHAVTMGWSDQVASEASLANLYLTVGGVVITANSIMSRALAVAGAGGTGLTSIQGLVIGGVPVSTTGVPNEVISLPGLTVILNEQIPSAGGIVVNALRVSTWPSLIGVVVGSAQAGL